LIRLAVVAPPNMRTSEKIPRKFELTAVQGHPR